MKKILLILFSLSLALPAFGQSQTNKVNNSAVIYDKGSKIQIYDASINTTNSDYFLKVAAFNASGTLVPTNVSFVSYASQFLTNAPSGTITNNYSIGRSITYTIFLTNNLTLANPVAPSQDQKITYRFIQDAVGSRTLTLGSQFRFGTDITAATLTTTANKTDYFGVIVNINGGSTNLDVVAFTKGY